MKRLILSLFVILGLLVVAAPAFAGGINLSGPHFNLNIIGVDNPKTQLKLDGHTIFVALGKKDGAPTPSNIWLTQGRLKFATETPSPKPTIAMVTQFKERPAQCSSCRVTRISLSVRARAVKPDSRWTTRYGSEHSVSLADTQQ